MSPSTYGHMSSVDTPFNVGSCLGPPRLSTSCGVQMLNKKICVMWLWRLLDTVNAWLRWLHFFKWDILSFRHYSAYTVLNTTWQHALFNSQLQDTEVFLTIGWSVSGVTYKGRQLRELLHSVQSYIGWVTTPVAWLLQSKMMREHYTDVTKRSYIISAQLDNVIRNANGVSSLQ